MTETVHNVSKQVLLDTHRMHDGCESVRNILSSRPFASKKGIVQATDLLLFFDSWEDPKSVIGLFLDLKQEKTILDSDFSPSCYHIGNETPLIDAALTCATVIKNSLERSFDKAVVKKVLDISPKQKGTKKSIAYFKGLTQSEVDEEVEYTIQANNRKGHNNIGITLALLTLWVNDIQSKHFDPWFLGIRAGGFYENNKKAAQICKIEGDFTSSPIVQRCLNVLTKRVLTHINEISDNEYSSIESFIVDVLDGDASLKHSNHYIEYESLTDCYEYYRIDGRMSALTPEYVAETVQSVFICYLQTCLELTTNASPLDVQNLKVKQNIKESLQLSDVNLQDIYLYLNDIDEHNILNACVWTVKNRQIKDYGIKLVDQVIDTFKNNRMNPDKPINTENKKEKKLQVKTLEKKIFEMEKELEHQSHLVSALRTENKRLKESKPSPTDKSDSSEWEYQKKYNKIMKQLNKSQQELSNEKSKNSALEEKIELLSRSMDSPVEICDIDPLKKYLFIVDDDRVRSKLKAWFPNSVIAEHIELNARNARCYYMSVVMAAKVSHVKYHHYKTKCIQFNIPVANCNGTNYQSICLAIRKCEQENNIM